MSNTKDRQPSSILVEFARSGWDDRHLGRRSLPYLAEVERGAVLKVMHAAGVQDSADDDDGLGLVAPLAYLWTLINNSPTHRQYERWVMHDLQPGTWHVHTGDDFYSSFPIRVGDIIAVTCELTKVYEKLGRRGRMVFIEDTWSFHNQDNRLAAQVIRKAVTVYNDQANSSKRNDRRPSPPSSSPTQLEDISLVDPSALKPGDIAYFVDHGPLTRTSMVEWMGAVDDYARTHYDPDYAAERGFVGGQPLAAGPQLGAMMIAPVLRWIGREGRIREFHHLQRHEVFPNEQLFSFGSVREVGDRGASCVVDAWLIDSSFEMRNSGTFLVEFAGHESST